MVDPCIYLLLALRQVLVNQPGRGPVSMPVGPCRVWYQHRGETLGLAMSRSLGDAIVHKCGVSAEPEILEHQVRVPPSLPVAYRELSVTVCNCVCVCVCRWTRATSS